MQMKELLKNKKVLIAGAIVLVLVVGTFVFISVNKARQNQALEVLENEEVIPTVDASVIVSLRTAAGKREVELTVKGIPKGTRSVEYELSYDAEGQGPQGAIGTVELKRQESSLSKSITLGTCSSGTCVYHRVLGKVRLALIFDGNYGQRLFEKEYDL